MKSKHLFYYVEWKSTYQVWFCNEIKFTMKVTYVKHCADVWRPGIEAMGDGAAGP